MHAFAVRGLLHGYASSVATLPSYLQGRCHSRQGPKWVGGPGGPSSLTLDLYEFIPLAAPASPHSLHAAGEHHCQGHAAESRGPRGPGEACSPWRNVPSGPALRMLCPAHKLQPFVESLGPFPQAPPQLLAPPTSSTLEFHPLKRRFCRLRRQGHPSPGATLKRACAWLSGFRSILIKYLRSSTLCT